MGWVDAEQALRELSENEENFFRSRDPQGGVDRRIGVRQVIVHPLIRDINSLIDLDKTTLRRMARGISNSPRTARIPTTDRKPI